MGQLLDTDIRQDGGERIGDIEIARAFRADLEQHRDAQLTKALGIEVVSAQRAQIAQRCLGVRNDRRPEFRALKFVQNFDRDRQRPPLTPDLVTPRAIATSEWNAPVRAPSR
jgi:hypothetical protein